MGVSIYVQNGNEENAVCITYSSFQKLRLALIQQFLKYLEMKYDINEESEKEVDVNEESEEKYAEICKVILKNSIKQESEFTGSSKSTLFDYMTSEINYNIFCCEELEYSLCHIPGGIGLYKFIDHSDCEGYHSPGDCFDMIETFSIVLSMNDQDSTNMEHFSNLRLIFAESVETKKMVIYS